MRTLALVLSVATFGFMSTSSKALAEARIYKAYKDVTATVASRSAFQAKVKEVKGAYTRGTLKRGKAPTDMHVESARAFIVNGEVTFHIPYESVSTSQHGRLEVDISGKNVRKGEGVSVALPDLISKLQLGRLHKAMLDGETDLGAVSFVVDGSITAISPRTVTVYDSIASWKSPQELVIEQVDVESKGSLASLLREKRSGRLIPLLGADSRAQSLVTKALRERGDLRREITVSLKGSTWLHNGDLETFYVNTISVVVYKIKGDGAVEKVDFDVDVEPFPLNFGIPKS